MRDMQMQMRWSRRRQLIWIKAHVRHYVVLSMHHNLLYSVPDSPGEYAANLTHDICGGL
jgi:hypothetical protein